MSKGILFYAHRLPPHPGGMEVHGGKFIDYFSHHPNYPILAVNPTHLSRYSPKVIFFNSGHWIEELDKIRKQHPTAKLIYRTGGNEIIKAELEKNPINNHKERQEFWVKQINDTIDVLITNSKYTEDRLSALGVSCPYFRAVGGASTIAPTNSKNEIPILFCAARFVPYKNHKLLISVADELFKRGHKFELRLAGDGPLEQVLKKSTSTDSIKFLGAISNQDCLEETQKADLYIQLSYDTITEVEGGKYVHAEGMGRSILEAISCGTYVVAGDSGALSEVVTKERGVLIKKGTPKEIANQIEPYILQKPSKNTPTNLFSWENLFHGYEQIFNRN